MTRIALLFRVFSWPGNIRPRVVAALGPRRVAGLDRASGLRVCALLVAFSLPVISQTYEAKLQIVPSEPQYSGRYSRISRGSDGSIQIEPLGATVMRIDPFPNGGILVHIQGSDPSTIALLPGQQSLISLQRTAVASARLPCVVGYSRVERDGKPVEYISWVPAYRAVGKLKLPACTLDLAVFDLNGDGLFDDADSRGGTSLGVDVDDDGRFYGAGEFRKMSEIIDLCGQPLEVAALDRAGESITFRTSSLNPATLNQTIPDFSVTTTEGRVFRPELSRGRLLLIDFWASWCAPCVASLQEVDKLSRQLGRDAMVVGINVDEADRCASATQMIKEKDLSFQQVMRCQGESDFLWKMFGSMAGARMSIPLYVVVDGKGIIRYAGTGGDELSDVKALFRKLMDQL